MVQAARLAGSLLAATAGGWAAASFGMPLAWLVGAAVVSAAISLTIGSVTLPLPLYRSGQLVVGVSVGLTVAADVAARIGPHVPLVILAAAASIALGRVSTPILARVGRLDRRTAYFALVPAGIAEMADLAQKRGADAGCVATLHAARVFLVVLILPPVIYHIGDPALLDTTRDAGVWTASLALALAMGLAAAVVGSAAGLPSAYIIGPMIVVSLLSGAGYVEAKEPAVLLATAQVLLGLGLGARFRRDRIMRLPRALAAGVAVLAMNGIGIAAAALGVAWALGLDPPLMLLALATGGTAEMVLTARVVGADAALVAVYQVTRGLCGNLFAGIIYDRTMRQALDEDRPDGLPDDTR
jgi:uncharacterized protein